ncbi:uncharacterized protein LOC129923722 [Biomphalaria glabrata]|uniref:Uncharacterized protein LOC129923722 n=1 Tax=Biomphalaria glabrata TaxID=6526 RepID=A0A9W2ZB17_BIOGL|nr:uncharacterized protein LOC129923722 [Biomphalaria glabrata]
MKSVKRPKVDIFRPPLQTYANQIENITKKSFSDVLFEDIKDYRRHIYESDCRAAEMRQEIEKLKQQALVSEAMIKSQQKTAKKQKESTAKLYTSMTCVVCLKHFDSVERLPFFLSCCHMVCEACKDKADDETIACRICGITSEAKTLQAHQILLDVIRGLENLILQ